MCGYAVTHLVEALRYKPEGRGFGFPTVSVEFFFDISFRPHCGPGIDSTSNINEYQEYFRGGGGGLRRSVGLADNLATFMCRLS